MHHELSILALIKGLERHIFVYDEESREPLLDAIREEAAQPQASLTWFDAATLIERARQQFREAEAERQSTRNLG
jgi:hypothetical protein